MRKLIFLVQKEFIQLFRDKYMPRMIFFLPIIQLLILSYTATFEIKTTKLAVVDQDKSGSSRELIAEFSGSTFFNIVQYCPSVSEAEELLYTRRVHQILVIENGFERNIVASELGGNVQLLVDAVDGSAAGIRAGYAQQVVNQFVKKVNLSTLGISKFQEPISVEWSNWYNPMMKYTVFMVPGILVLLITLIGMFLTSMNIVKEKEMGTIEQINVTPIQKWQFIAGKLLPFWIIGLFELGFGLIVAKIVFGITVAGSYPLLFAIAAIYLIMVMSLGLIVSTLVDTQQQAMFISWFFLVIFILLSGLFTATDNMPQWVQSFNYINPVAYFIKVIRLLILKGAALNELYVIVFQMLAYAAIALSFAVMRYKKTV